MATNNYTIQVLQTGHIELRGACIYYMIDFDRWEPFIYTMLVVRGNGKTVVINSGVDDDPSFLDPLWKDWPGERNLVTGIGPIVPVLTEAGHPAVDNPHPLGVDVFAELEKLVVAQAVGGAIAPQRPVTRTRVYGADGLFPLHAILHRHALDDTATGKAHEAGLEVRQQLSQVGAAAVGAVLERLPREQGDEVNIEASG